MVLLTCLMFAATALPSVSAAATTLTTVDYEDIYVVIARNQTADDISELLGLSLDKDDTLYLSYYNITDGVLVHNSTAAYEDSDDVVWFNLSMPTAHVNWTINLTNRQCYFSDEAITDANYGEASTGLLINETISDETFVFIVTIPDGVEFEYDDNFFTYEDNQMTVLDDDGDEIANISSYEYNSTYKVYGMNYSDDDSSHQIAVVAKDIHGTATAVTGKRVTSHKWYWFDTAIAYTINTESTTGYNIFTSEDGYLAFNVYKDTGFVSQYYGKTAFRMTADSLKYDASPIWKFWGSDWISITAHESAIKGIKIGLIEYIYISEKTGAEDNDEILRDNYGVVTSRGVSTSCTGFLEYVSMWTTKTPDAAVDAGKAIF